MTGSKGDASLTLHMVSSLDGFIAKKDNSVGWLENAGGVYEAGVSISEEEAAAFVRTIDCYVMGSHTYEHALELGWPYGDTPVVVVSGKNGLKQGRVLRSIRAISGRWLM
jgi:dihydrofolate reductase